MLIEMHLPFALNTCSLPKLWACRFCCICEWYYNYMCRWSFVWHYSLFKILSCWSSKWNGIVHCHVLACSGVGNFHVEAVSVEEVFQVKSFLDRNV